MGGEAGGGGGGGGGVWGGGTKKDPVGADSGIYPACSAARDDAVIK